MYPIIHRPHLPPSRALVPGTGVRTTSKLISRLLYISETSQDDRENRRRYKVKCCGGGSRMQEVLSRTAKVADVRVIVCGSCCRGRVAGAGDETRQGLRGRKLGITCKA